MVSRSVRVAAQARTYLGRAERYRALRVDVVQLPLHTVAFVSLHALTTFTA